MSRKNLIEYLYKEMCHHGFGDLEYWKYYFTDKEDSKKDIIEFINVDINLFKKIFLIILLIPLIRKSFWK